MVIYSYRHSSVVKYNMLIRRVIRFPCSFHTQNKTIQIVQVSVAVHSWIDRFGMAEVQSCSPVAQVIETFNSKRIAISSRIAWFWNVPIASHTQAQACAIVAGEFHQPLNLDQLSLVQAIELAFIYNWFYYILKY